MQKKHKWYILSMICIFCVAVVCFIYGTSQKYFTEYSELKINQVLYISSDNVKNVKEDITEKLDLSCLQKLMGNIKCKRYRVSFAPYQQKDVRYEIHGIYQKKPIHILLGESQINYVYIDSGKGGYRIENAHDIMQALEQLRMGTAV